MHSRIGPAGSVYVHRLAGYVPEHMLYLTLYSADIGLYLPSAEMGAIV
jgi:hypothetical protein